MSIPDIGAYEYQMALHTGEPYPGIHDLTATAISSTRVDLAWKDPYVLLPTEPSWYLDRIGIYRKVSGGAYSEIAVLINTEHLHYWVTTWSDTTVQGGIVYTYYLDCILRAGAFLGYLDSSNEASTTTPTPLQAPTNLAGTANSDTKITITWEDNSTNETGFEVRMKNAGGTYALITTTAANIETYAKTGLTASTKYYFKVRAINAAGYSPDSNVIAVTTKDTIHTGVTLSNHGHQDIWIIDKVSAEVTDYPPVIVVPSDVLARKFEIIATDSGTYKVDDTHADNGYPVSSYIRTKDLDFTDQHPDIAGMIKTIRKFRLIYEDIDADTPVTVYISNDGGENWNTASATVGTGDGHVKVQDFYFMNSDYVTGMNFTFKVESLSTTQNFLWLAFEIDFFVRGEHFNV